MVALPFPLFLTPTPHVHKSSSLHLCLCSCPANTIICTIFPDSTLYVLIYDICFSLSDLQYFLKLLGWFPWESVLGSLHTILTAASLWWQLLGVGSDLYISLFLVFWWTLQDNIYNLTSCAFPMNTYLLMKTPSQLLCVRDELTHTENKTWRRKWQPTPVFFPGKPHGQETGGVQSIGLQSVGHDCSDLALHRIKQESKKKS